MAGVGGGDEGQAWPEDDAQWIDSGDGVRVDFDGAVTIKDEIRLMDSPFRARPSGARRAYELVQECAWRLGLPAPADRNKSEGDAEPEVLLEGGRPPHHRRGSMAPPSCGCASSTTSSIGPALEQAPSSSASSSKTCRRSRPWTSRAAGSHMSAASTLSRPR